jgi:rare lipoprotein A
MKTLLRATLVVLFSFVLQAQSFTGIASWYGIHEQGHKMANGKPFDRFAFTAASKTLPLGTNILVTNLKTKQTVIVEITDRGPWVKGRILDLSEKASKQIDCSDLCKVQVTVIDKVLR